ncbi:hypothetical protein ColTof3_13668 [Colletotrichum tofieldiae]|nr:hypothetical protein ColTof3_13668 [Colletotrichum tofieldiae]
MPSQYTASHILGQLSNGTWLENLAVRPNGNLLVAQAYPTSVLYTVSHPSRGKPSLESLVNIPTVQNLHGISQVSVSSGQETYIVIGGNATGLAGPITGEFSAWILSFVRTSHGERVDARKISDMSEHSTFLNGVTSIPGVSNAVLVADSATGVVGYHNVTTGDFDTTAFTFPEMSTVGGASSSIGVNRIHILDSYLYWTNSFFVSLFRVRILPSGYPVPCATPELVANLSGTATTLDDFAFGNDGGVYITTNLDNSIIRVDPATGLSRTVIGSKDSMLVAGSTTVAFGKGLHGGTLYVTTSGPLGAPVNGTKTEGAKVVAVEIEF